MQDEMRALIIGVSDYSMFPSAQRPEGLPLCRNDALKVSLSLERAFGVRPENMCVLSGCVTTDSVCKALASFSEEAGSQLLVYFSGHGGTSPEENNERLHFLCFSDGYVLTSSILESVDSSFRSKLLVLDTCHAGAVMPSEGELRRTPILEEPGTGTLIVMSSKANQQSSNYYKEGLPSGADDNLSAFTHMFCTAMNGYYGTRRPTIDLLDVLDYCQRLNHAYNNRVPIEHKQQMVVYGDIAGGFIFRNPRYIEMRPIGRNEQVLHGGRVRFEPHHTQIEKRYSASIVISEGSDPVDVIKEVVEQAKSLELYHDESEARCLRNVRLGRLTGHAFANDKDLGRSNPKYHFCWNSDGEPVQGLASGERLYGQNGLTIVEIGSYGSVSKAIENNTMCDAEVWYASVSVIPQVDLLKRQVSNLIDRFDSGLATREELVKFSASNWGEAMQLASYPLDIGYAADTRMELLVNKLCGLTGCLRDMVLNCSDRAIATRSSDAGITMSVKACIRMYNDDYRAFYKLARELDPTVLTQR